MMTAPRLKTICVNFSLFVFPLLLLLVLEWTLRRLDYDFPDRLFLREEIVPGEPVYYLNARLKKKYQFTRQFGIFDPIFPDRMAYSKIPGSLRIFCLGGSTTQGYPYFHNGAFPAFLQAILEESANERPVEVVNLGVTAMNSYGVLDFMKKIPAYQPDLLVVYMGHNEFYGALGSASQLSFSNNRTLVLATLKLQEFKVYLLARNAWETAVSWFRPPRPLTATLMEEISGKRTIPPDDPLREITFRNFEANLQEIIRIAEKADVPMILSTVAGNLRSFHPFESMPPEGMAADALAGALEKGDVLLAQRDFSSALDAYREAHALYPKHAATHYRLGRAYDAAGDRVRALEHFQLARDLDVIPFRAPQRINEVIRSVASRHAIPLLDLDALLSLQNDGHILGDPWMMEHVHPSYLGNYAIAWHLARSLADLGFVKPIEGVDPWETSFQEQVLARSGFSWVDQWVAEQRVNSLVQAWPFHLNNSTFTAPDLPKDTGHFPVTTLPDIQFNLPQVATLHSRVGQAYTRNFGDWNRALREWQAAVRLDMFNGRAHLELGRIYLRLEHHANAASTLERATVLEPALHEARRLTAFAYLKQERYTEAAEQLASYLEQVPADIPMQFELAMLLEFLEHPQTAIERYRILLTHDENHEKARERLEHLK